MKPLTIGRLAEQAGVGVETVRFYEREGLLEEPQRRASGYRQYGQEAVARIRFIRRAKELGFTLKEIKELLNLRVDPTTTCANVKVRAKAKIDDIRRRIESLQQMKQALVSLSEACSGEGPSSECPILDWLEPASAESGVEVEDD